MSDLKIKVTDLKKSYGENHVLKGIDLNIGANEVVVIIGPSGSGKSTLLRCLNRLEEPTSGQIIVDNVDIGDPKADINRVRQDIGMVFQHFNLFNNLSVADNITLAPMELKGFNKAGAEAQLRKASRALDKSVSKGVFHRNNAANKKSGMAAAFNKMN